jgi:phosphoserine phosphatase RsbU/P
MAAMGTPGQPQSPAAIQTRQGWKQFLQLEEELVQLPDTQSQCRLIEETVELLLSAQTHVWLARPFYPLPGEPNTELLPQAAAPDLVQRVRLDGESCCASAFDSCEDLCEPSEKAFVAGIPLLTNHNLLGVLQVQFPPGNPITAQNLDLLECLAGHAAVALEISRQARIKNWRYEQLSLVRSVSSQIANLLNLNQICTRVTELIQKAFNYYYVAIFTLLPGQDMLQFQAAASHSGVQLQPTFSVKLGDGMIGAAAQSGEQIIAPDVYLEPHFRYLDVFPETLSEACFPLKVENQILGVLDVQSDQLDDINETDILVLGTLADNIALAIQAARLYSDLEARAGQISTVIEVSHALNSIIDLDTLLGEIVQIIQRRFGYEHVHLFSVHPGRRLVIYQTGSGERSEAMHNQLITYPLDTPLGIIPWVARNGQSFLSNDVNKEPLYVPAELPPYNTGAELTVPLLFGADVIGVLDIQRSETNIFTENDRKLFEALASSIAITYRNATLYRSEKWRRQVADSFRDVAYQVTNNANLDELLDIILTRLESNLPCIASAVWLVEDELDIVSGQHDRPLRLAAAHNVEPETLNQGLRDNPELFNALQALQEAPQPYIRTASDPIGPLGYALNLNKDYSSIAAPMRAENRTVGLLMLAHNSPGRYGSEAQSMTATFASYASAAIQNARLFAEAQEQAWVSTMLVQVAEASQSTMSVDDLLATMIRLTRLLVGVRKCAFLLRVEGQPYYVLKAWYGFEPSTPSPSYYPVSLPGFVRMEEKRAPNFLNDPGSELGLPEADLKGKNAAVVAFPMLVRGEVVGAFVVAMHVNQSATGEKGFVPNAMAILQGIAHQTSITVENLRLLEARQEEAYVTAALLQVAQAVVSANELSEILENVVHLLPILVGIDVCLIYQWDVAGKCFRPTHAHGENRKQEKYLLEQSYPPETHILLDCVFNSGQVHLSLLDDSEILAENWPSLPCTAFDHNAPTALLPREDWLLGFPLTIQNQVLGVMVTRERSASPSVRERRLEIINGIAQQTSLAIQNDFLKHEMVESERIEREISLTRQIQEIFLPDQLPSSYGWEIDIRWETARQVGGDFYDAFQLDDHHIGLVIADVSDKGLPAALYMTVTRTLIRANITDNESPADVLVEVNRLLFSDSPESMFITAVCAILDTDTGQLVFANAGHNRPLIFRGESGQVEQLPKGGTALGVLPDLELNDHTLTIHPNDAIVFFTDGATDTLSPDGEDFGEDRLRQIIRANAMRPVYELLQALDAAFSDFRNGTPLADDITLLAVRRQ